MTLVKGVVAAVEAVEADEVVAADVAKARTDVVEAVLDAEKLTRAVRIVQALAVPTLVPPVVPTTVVPTTVVPTTVVPTPTIPPPMGPTPTHSFC